jgi:hypothetical protein
MQLVETIRTMIQDHRDGDCPPPDELARLYREQRVRQVPFDHVLCCEPCLNVVNDILGLPRLDERHPFDALSRQRSTWPVDSSSEINDDDWDPPAGRGGEEELPGHLMNEVDEQMDEPAVSVERLRQAMSRAYEARPDRLMLCINGRPYASLSAEQACQTSTFWPDEEPEFIEVLDDQGLCLAYMEVSPERLESGPQQGRVALSGSRDIELRAYLDQQGRPAIQVTCHHPAAEMAAAKTTEKTGWAWFNSLFGWQAGSGVAWRAPALAMGMAMVMLGSMVVLLFSLAQTRGELHALRQEREQLLQRFEQLANDLEAIKRQPPSPSPEIPPRDIAPKQSVPEPTETAQLDDPTRGTKPKPPVVSLSAVKRIYMFSFGDDALSRQIREQIIRELQASGRFVVTDKPDEADAAFKGTITPIAPESESARMKLELVDANGRVLWRTTQKATAADIVRRFLDDVQRASRRR